MWPAWRYTRDRAPLAANPAISARAASTTSSPAFSGEPASKGGCGSNFEPHASKSATYNHGLRMSDNRLATWFEVPLFLVVRVLAGGWERSTSAWKAVAARRSDSGDRRNRCET
jgi:hypothetical protein